MSVGQERAGAPRGQLWHVDMWLYDLTAYGAWEVVETATTMAVLTPFFSPPTSLLSSPPTIPFKIRDIHVV